MNNTFYRLQGDQGFGSAVDTRTRVYRPSRKRSFSHYRPILVNTNPDGSKISVWPSYTVFVSRPVRLSTTRINTRFDLRLFPVEFSVVKNPEAAESMPRQKTLSSMYFRGSLSS